MHEDERMDDWCQGFLFLSHISNYISIEKNKWFQISIYDEEYEKIMPAYVGIIEL